MIQEYNMRSAIPINGIERIIGYYYSYIRHDNGKREHCILQDITSLTSDFKINYIDPDTIQPVKLKPVLKEFPTCPNCQNTIDVDVGFSYCITCGMALEFEQKADIK